MLAALTRGLIFYAVFTGLYWLMQWVILVQADWALSLNRTLRRILFTWVILLALAPALLGLAGFQTGPAALAAYLWMGLAFYLFLGCLLLVPLRWLGGRRIGRPAFLILLALSLFLVGHGYYTARRPQVSQVTVETAKLPPGLDQIRIVLMSDLHLYSVEAESRLERILKVIEPLEYDLLISAGDLIDARLDQADWPALARRLAEVKPSWGKFAVRGNHEYYTDQSALDPGRSFSTEFHRAAGFDLLINQKTLVGEALRVVGLDDGHYASARANPGPAAKLLAGQNPVRFTLLLKHRPTVEPGSQGRFDLQLSGHTHGGQMWPFGCLVRRVFPVMGGLLELDRGSRLLVSRGAGTWGPPVRVGSSPEVILLLIKRSQGSG